MVKHIILWTLKDEFSTDEKDKIKLGIKEGLESLTGRIPGLVDIKVNISGLESSTVDLMHNHWLSFSLAVYGLKVLQWILCLILHLKMKQH